MAFFPRIENLLTFKKVLLILFIAGFLVYSNSIQNGFVWDDEEQIVNNAIIHEPGNINQIFSGGTFSTGGGTELSGWFYRPFLSFLLMFNYFLWGPNPFGYHIFQISLHCINGFLLFLILERLINTGASKKISLINFLLSLLFIMHPGINEGVVYISAVNDTAYATLAATAFYLVVTYKEKFSRDFLICLFLLLALTTKEPALSVFPVIWGYLILFKPKTWRRVFLLSIGTLAFYLFVRLGVFHIPFQHPRFSPISEADLQTRLLTVPKILYSYILLFLFPVKLAISQHFVTRNLSIKDFFLPFMADTLFLCTWTFLAWKYKSKSLFLGLIFFSSGFAIISNIFPLDMSIAERWFYFPVFGILIGISSVFSILIGKYSKALPALLVFLTFVLILFSTRTILRNFDWRDGLTLYSHDINVSKNSFDLENNLGVELFRAGRIPEAKVHFQNSLILQPKWHFAINNLGAVYQSERDYPKAKELFEKVLQTSDYYLAHENLSSIYLEEKDYQKAGDFAGNSLKKLPNNPVLWLNLAVAEYKLGHKENALEAAKNAYILNPNNRSRYIYLQLSQGKELEFE